MHLRFKPWISCDGLTEITAYQYNHATFLHRNLSSSAPSTEEILRVSDESCGSKRNRKLKVAILAGGRGRRLGFLTSFAPKPMLKVSNRPFLEHVILDLRKQGFKDLILLCGYQANRIKDYFRDGDQWKVRIQYSIETHPLGTGGAIKLAEPYLNRRQSFLLLNGDTFLKDHLKQMIRFHQRVRARLTMAVSKVVGPSETGRQFGSLTLNQHRQIVQFSEKVSTPHSVYLNAGAYVVHPSILRMIPKGKPFSLEHQLFPRLISRRFYGWPAKAKFMDIGTVSRYRIVAQKLKT